MEVFRRAANPWGQEVLLGIAWDLMWAALILGVGFVVVHGLYARWIARTTGGGEEPLALPGTPERVVRHSTASRWFHWLMAATMFALLITAFFPVVGIRFAWVTIHWIAGIALSLLILYHTVRATFKQDFWSMGLGRDDLAEASAAVKRFFRRRAPGPARAGKYPLDHKLFHHAAAVVGLIAIVTGLLMMFRIDTVLWNQNPYFLSDSTWGLVYVAHGLSGVALITLTVAHIYFAIRPEKWWLTRSMIRGWITREEYLGHYDPERWSLTDASAPRVTEVAPPPPREAKPAG